MSQLKYETGMWVATVKGAIRSFQSLPIPPGTIGVITAVDAKDKQLPRLAYFVEFTDFQEWMFEDEITPLDEVTT
jgi:hypothetical protein